MFRISYETDMQKALERRIQSYNQTYTTSRQYLVKVRAGINCSEHLHSHFVFHILSLQRKDLYEKRKTISDLALAVGLLGIVLMIVETELTMANVYTKVSICHFSACVISSDVFAIRSNTYV